MPTTLVIVPAEKISVRKILRNIFTDANVRTWQISSGGTVLTHGQYHGKVRLYKGGYLIVSASNSDYEALTLGAFINLLHRRAKEGIRAVTVVL
jgi:hypothetical protein